MNIKSNKKQSNHYNYNYNQNSGSNASADGNSYSDGPVYNRSNPYTRDVNNRNTAAAKKAAENQGKKNQVTGGAPAVILLILSIVFIIMGIGYVIEGVEYTYLYDILKGASFLLGGGASFIARGVLQRRVRRLNRYLVAMGLDDAKDVAELSNSTGISQKLVRKDLKYLADRGYFGPTAYFDIGLDSIVISAEAAESEREARMAHEQAKGPVTQNQHMSILQQMRSLNDSIHDSSISAKISHLETITSKIFRIVDDNPEKEPQIRKFMNYYLPSTIKLLRSYSVLERQGVNGQNITTTKKDIERILDTLTDGFEKQLDLLFNSDALDISSDIDVLENMLKQDGLSEDGNFFSQSGTN